MRRFLTVLILLMPSLALAGTCGNGYGHSSQLLLQKAIGGDQTNYPYPIVGTYSVLKTAANGGQVQSTANNALSRSGPADLVLCDAAASGNLLKFEVAQYTATTGAIEIYVLIPTLHSASNDSIYLFTNNSGVVTSQQDAGLGDCSTNFWITAGYKYVVHHPDGTTLDLKDSACGTTNTAQGTLTATTGKLDGASNGYTAAGNANYVKVTSSSAYKPTSALSMEAWGYPTSCASDPYVFGLDYHASGAWTSPFVSYALTLSSTSCRVRPTVATGSGTFNGVTGSAVTPNAWNYMAGTYNGTTLATYLNGAPGATGAASGSIDYGASVNLDLGTNSQYIPLVGWAGKLDEMRISSNANSANWIATNYNSQAFPSFQIVGQTFATPTVVNQTTCGSNSATMSCALPFSVTSGGYILLAVTANSGNGCITPPTDSLGLTYTNVVTAHVTGTADGYSCIYSAPITAVGADTITIQAATSWAVAYEVKTITASGVATASTTSNMPITMTATAPSSNSFLLCVTIGDLSTAPGGPTPATYSFTSLSGPDPAFQYRWIGAAYGVVASGSQSCSFASGFGGVTAIFGASTPQTSKRRPSQVY